MLLALLAVLGACGNSTADGSDEADVEREVQLETRTSRRVDDTSDDGTAPAQGTAAPTTSAPRSIDSVPTTLEAVETQDAETAEAEDGTSIDVASTTTAPTVESTTTTTIAPEPECGSLRSVPAGAVEFRSVSADVDGDGLADEVSTYGEPGRVAWLIRIELGAGEGMELVIEDAVLFDIGFPLIRPLGAADLDADGELELFAVVSASAATESVAVFDTVGCTVVRMQNAVTGNPLLFPVGSSVGYSVGLRCDAGGFSTIFGRSFDGETWSGEITPYEVFGPLVEPGLPLDADWVGAETVAAEVATLACAGIEWVPSVELE